MITHFPTSQLTTYGFPPDLVRCIINDGVDHLLPIQARALIDTDLLRGGNILALAPTSAGKTLLGELAACRQWQAGRKAIFLSPTKALVTSQYHHLRRRYAQAGIRVVMATADHTAHDDDIRSGNFDFAVMVYEKARSYIITEPALACNTGVVVADELQIIHDAERGPTADMLLSRLHCCEVAVQIIGLSAVLERADEIAGWLDAQILTSSTRPCELREGAWCEQHKMFHYKHNDDWKDEPLAGDAAVFGGSFASLNRTDGLAEATALAVQLARSGENCLIFVPTRSLSRQVALAAAQELGISDEWQPAECPELALAEESSMRGQLELCLPARVAFHNSDLTADLRDAVEQRFNAGQIGILVATPTLAQGVNLRAKNVIHVPLMLGPTQGHAANHHRRPQISLSPDRYKNQAGRAGRYGLADTFGRSILIARTHTEAVRLARQYIEAAPQAFSRPPATSTLEAFILDFVEAGIASTFSEILKTLGSTFTWKLPLQPQCPPDLADAVGECLRRLIDWNLLEETAASRLLVTGLGQAAAAGGFRATTITELMRWCGHWGADQPGEMEILLACAFTEDGEDIPVSASPDEIRTRRWMRQAEALLRRDNAWDKPHVQAVLRPAGGLSPARHGMVKLAVLASHWISRRETGELESELATSAGALAAAATHLAWIAAGLQSCAHIAGCTEITTAQLRQVAFRLPPGLARSASGLAQSKIPGLTRNYLHRLADAGFDSVDAIKTASADVLARTIPAGLALRIVAEFQPEQGEITREDLSCTAGKNAAPPVSDARENPHAPVPQQALASVQPPTLESVKPPGIMETQSRRSTAEFELILDQHNPGTVVFRGQTVQLSPKPYALLGVLARRCGTTVSYLEIDENVWPGEKVEPQQISAHKSRLIKELARASTPQEAKTVIVTAPRYGLRLNLPPTRVQVR